MFEPLTLQGAILRASSGEDVYAVTQNDAEILCNDVSERFGYSGFEGPTNDGYPQNAMHYHPNTGDSGIRPHVFYENDPNLKMKLLP